MPRSAKQRAQAIQYRNNQPALRASAPAAESWWTRPQTRAEFDEVARKEQPRMADSVFGRQRAAITATE